MTVEDVANRYWSKMFGLPVADVLRPGVTVVADAPGLLGYAGMYLLRLRDACVIAAPSRLASNITQVVGDHGVADVFTAGFAVRIAGNAGLVLGPSWHGYVLRADVAPASDTRPRRLTAEDAQGLRQLREIVGDAEWGEGGFNPLPVVMWGIDDAAGLAAVGKLGDFDGAPADVGVVTRTDVRGEGYATAIVRSMCAATDPSLPALRYRALESNHASLAVAARVGFVGYGANIAVRLAASS